jgi:hypothetical protein
VPFPVPADYGTPTVELANRMASVTVDAYHRSAVNEARVHPCRNRDCDHYAPAPGDACPVCADRGFTSLIPGGSGDAA